MFTLLSIGGRGLLACAALWACAAVADEGMWLFNAPPRERLERDHGIGLSPEWLLHLQQAAVRFNSGGSGAFVSEDGLVVTNHHVAAGCLQKLGDAAHDYHRDGFAAATRDDELKCHDLELNVLISIEDVTPRVTAAIAAGLSPEAAAESRRAVLAAIEQESLASTGLRSDVVTLYQGGAFHLYRYRKYTDVRLVFAPEHQIAFFGGDADNFEFPRFDLDICFFRAYEHGKPARVPHRLVWSTQPVAAGDLVFVAGHPGHTDRDDTVAELLSMRDRRLPFDLRNLNRLEALYRGYADEGPEERRQATADLRGVENGRKARQGILAGLLDPALLDGRRRAEAAMRPLVEERLTGVPSPYARIEEAQQILDGIATRHRMLEGAAAFNSGFFANARTILRMTTEDAKPSGERLREYRDSNRGSLELRLYSEEPLFDEFEIVKLADSLTFLAAVCGADDPLVTKVLAAASPRDRARALIAGTTLGRRPAMPGRQSRPDTRRELVAGGAAAVAASADTMLALAALVDEESRRLRKTAEAAEEIKQQAHAEIARARFATHGATLSPDATFTLRLAYGTVKGLGNATQRQPPGGDDDASAFTTFAGLFARAAAKDHAPPFDLPPRWERLRPELEKDAGFLDTHLDFVSTADIIGGNSGSPVVNRAGELVGVIFDGNIDSLVLDLVYDDLRARAIAVDAAGILAALRKVYGADRLIGELLAGAGAEWRPLFDGHSLGDWRQSEFGGGGEVTVIDEAIHIPPGADLNGVTWHGDFPRQRYELELQARRVDGNDFFCGLTFPVGEECCSLIIGGWGGSVTGLSSIDGRDAGDNETTDTHSFEQGRWYDVRVRVGPERIECFLDGAVIVDQEIEHRRITVRDEVLASRPLGVATYATTGEARRIRWRPLSAVAP